MERSVFGQESTLTQRSNHKSDTLMQMCGALWMFLQTFRVIKLVPLDVTQIEGAREWCFVHGELKKI